MQTIIKIYSTHHPHKSETCSTDRGRVMQVSMLEPGWLRSTKTHGGRHRLATAAPSVSSPRTFFQERGPKSAPGLNGGSGSHTANLYPAHGLTEAPYNPTYGPYNPTYIPRKVVAANKVGPPSLPRGTGKVILAPAMSCLPFVSVRF